VISSQPGACRGSAVGVGLGMDVGLAVDVGLGVNAEPCPQANAPLTSITSARSEPENLFMAHPLTAALLRLPF
jgi:hypothetical protein